VLGYFPRKKNYIEARNDFLVKEEKKYGKFVRCPVCGQYLMVLYLMPYDRMEGEEIRMPKANRLIRSNHKLKSLQS
jgi:hypothetical protein